MSSLCLHGLALSAPIQGPNICRLGQLATLTCQQVLMSVLMAVRVRLMTCLGCTPSLT